MSIFSSGTAPDNRRKFEDIFCANENRRLPLPPRPPPPLAVAPPQLLLTSFGHDEPPLPEASPTAQPYALPAPPPPAVDEHPPTDSLFLPPPPFAPVVSTTLNVWSSCSTVSSAVSLLSSSPFSECVYVLACLRFGFCYVSVVKCVFYHHIWGSAGSAQHREKGQCKDCYRYGDFDNNNDGGGWVELHFRQPVAYGAKW